MKGEVLFTLDFNECMATAMAMSGDNRRRDDHDDDLVMPGFRFHPTEEELIEFYLRRKVEGKHFNIELITFIDLYRYDPWELPAFATIGEKEWFFYVPRDRKYRNSDRPNRVSISGYWKATGADRTIRGENSKPIGLKKTLVFYSGKAPKGIRTSWIMNEYRLAPSETNQYRKVELSLCRVYRRTVVEDGLQHHGGLSTKPSSVCPNQLCQTSASFKNEILRDLQMDTTCKENLSSAISDPHFEPVGLTPEAQKLTESIQELSTIITEKPLVSLVSNATADDGRAQQQTMAVATTVDGLERIVDYNRSFLNQQMETFLTVASQDKLLETLSNSVQDTEPKMLWE